MSKQKKGSANPMWGGQFSSGPAEVMERINVSIDFDRLLSAQDIAGSIAHANMLGKQGILKAAEVRAIVKGLEQIRKEIESGKFTFRRELEDIHMNIESRLAELIGDAAGRLHTARSRNDQVATDFRLYVRDALDVLNVELQKLQRALMGRATEHVETIMPGFTHLQTAQPVTLGHHLMAYVEMFGRDRSRIVDARARMNESPLGSAALAGTSFPIDRKETARALGFARPMANSLDGVSDRDFALEFSSIASICAIHLSRLAEEFILWSSAQFGFVRLSDAFTTGSSIMPQKRNPDAAELVRGKTGQIMGDLVSLMTLMKALPLAYNKDMQEDKLPVFDTFEQLRLCIAAMTGMVSDFTANKETMKKAASYGYATATDLADWLVRSLNIPFRKAHHITANIVKLAEKMKCGLEELTLKEIQSVEKRITKEVFNVLGVDNSIHSRTSLGGTAPVQVKKAIAEARKKYL